MINTELFSSSANSEQSELILTKLQPPLSQHVLRRPRLLSLIDDHRGVKLIFVHAPAGFGKTTLITDWLAQAKIPFSWLSIDQGDDNENTFLRYLLASCQQFDGRIGRSAARLLDGAQPSQTQTILTRLINDLTDLSAECYIVFDDYHLIQNPAIHEAMDFMLTHLPSGVHLIITSRSRPPLQIATLRARRQLLEVSVDDLRFSRAEAAVFLKEMMGVSLSPHAVAELEARTEGWIAGIQLAALSLRGQASADFFTNFTTDSYIEEYLLDEVIKNQSESTRGFLAKTAILERLTAPLCDAVTDRHDGQEMLEHLEQASLFTFSLDNHREWFTYHHLFRQFLRRRLEASEEDVAALHRRAARWYYDSGFTSQAIEHSLSAPDTDQATLWIAGAATRLIFRGEVTVLQRWLDHLPEGTILIDPRLCLARAWCYITDNQRELGDAQAVLDFIDRTFTITDPALGAEIKVLQAYICRLHGDAEKCMMLSFQALEHLDPHKDAAIYGFLVSNLGEGFRLSGDLSAWEDYLARTLIEREADEDPTKLYYLLASHAVLRMARAELPESAAIWEKGITLSGQQNIPVVSLLYTHLSRILYEWNQIDAAKANIEKGLGIAREAQYVQTLWEGNTILARIKQVMGDSAGAIETIDLALHHSMSEGSSWVMEEVKAYRAFIYLQQGNLAEVERWERSCSLCAEDVKQYNHVHKVPFMVLARLKIAQRQWEDVDTILASTYERAKKRDRQNFLIEIVTLHALSLYLRGDLEGAKAALQEILAPVENGRYLRTFINEGPPMARMLAALSDSGLKHPALARIMRAFDEVASPALGLSSREVEILRLMAEHLTSNEIADQLVISVNTSRTHIKRIYEKLNAHSRGEAIDIARLYKLI